MLLSLKPLILKARPLVESGMWAGLSTASKAISQLIIVKWIALKFGPSTLGIAGQAMSLIAILQTLAGGGIANGVIRRFAVDADFPERRREFVSASFSYGLLFSSLFMGIGIFGSKRISIWAFGHEQYEWFVWCLGISSFFSFGTSFAQSLLSAKGLVRNIFGANFFGLFVGVSAFIVASLKYGESGVLIGLLALILGPTIFFSFQLLGRPWFSFLSLKPSFNLQIKNELVPFTLISTIGGAFIPIIYVMLRSGIEDRMGWDQVGYWQAILKVSELIFSFLGLFFASTFYPKVAAAKSSDEAFAIVSSFLLPFIFVLASGLLVLGIFGESVLSLIYSDAYRFLKSDLNVLLLGGFFRAIAWLCAFVLMARDHLKVYLVLEFITSMTLYFICRFGLEQGFSALIWAQVTHSVLYLLMLSSTVIYLYRSQKL